MKKIILGSLMSLVLFGAFAPVWAEDSAAASSDANILSLSENGYKKWKSATKKVATVALEKDGETPVMVIKITTDMKDGDCYPRIYKYFNPKLDFFQYKAIAFEYQIVKGSDTTPFYLFIETAAKVRITYPINGGKADGTWHKVVITRDELIKRSEKDEADWEEIFMMNFGLGESKYSTTTEIEIKIKNLRLE